MAALVLWLLWQAIVPLGSITYKSDLADNNYFIGKLSPSERVEQINNRPTIIGEPVYFSFFTPRPFRTAKLTMRFSGTAPLVEIGLRRDKTVWSYEMKPLYSALLEKIKADENTIIQNDVFLWQKNRRYETIEDFLKTPPPFNSVAVYRHPLPFAFSLSGSARQGATKEQSLGLRGAYQFYTYSDGNSLAFDFNVIDRNENSDPDPIEVIIYRGADRVFAQSFDDSVAKSERRLSIATPPLPAGVYRLELKANDDIVTTKLRTAQSKIAFSGRLWLVDAARENIILYGDGSRYSAQTLNPSSLQTIMIDDQAFAISETYEQFSLSIPNSERRLKRTVLPKGDLIIASDGLWSFTAEQFFNPTVRSMPPVSTVAELGVDYLVAKYEPVEILADGSFEQSMEFDLRGAYREKGKYSFMISAPNAALSKEPLNIKEIKIEVLEPDIYDYVRRYFERN